MAPAKPEAADLVTCVQSGVIVSKLDPKTAATTRIYYHRRAATTLKRDESYSLPRHVTPPRDARHGFLMRFN